MELSGNDILLKMQTRKVWHNCHTCLYLAGYILNKFWKGPKVTAGSKLIFKAEKQLEMVIFFINTHLHFKIFLKSQKQ